MVKRRLANADTNNLKLSIKSLTASFSVSSRDIFILVLELQSDRMTVSW